MAIWRTFRFSVPLLLFGLTACIAPEPVQKPPLENEGEVVVYLEPLPQSARDLRFVFDSVSAIGADGTRIPLQLSMANANGAELLDRQRRLAAGTMAEGSYSGLSLQLSSARLLAEDGEADLLISDAPIRIARPFTVNRRRATALFLRFDGSGLLPGTVVFEPMFSLHTTDRQLFNLYGYVSNTGVNRITVFNKKTMRVTDVIATGRRPAGMAMAEQRRRVYVACAGDHRIEEIDIMEGAVVGAIELQFGDGPRELAVTPDERTLVATNYDSDSVSIVDLSARTERFRVAVGRRPLGVAIDDTGSLAFVVNSLSNAVSVVDIQQGGVIAQLPVETMPLRAVFEPKNDRLLVIHENSPNLLVFDASRFSLLAKIFAGPGATGIAKNPSSGLVYVSNRSGEILVVSPQALMFVDTFDTGPAPLSRLVFEEEETSLYAIRPGDNALLKIDLTSKRILSTLEAEEDAYAVAVSGER